MKSFATLISILICSTLVIGQECDDYLLLNEGSSLEYTNYDKKGNPITVGNHQALEVDNVGGKYTSKIKLDVKNIKKGDTFTMEYDVGCEDGVFSIDMSRFFDSSQLMQYEGADFNIDIESDMLYFPKDLVEGEELNDGNITIKVNKDGFTLVTMTMKVFNRKVLGKESITTKAGTFDCQKVIYDFESKFGFIGARGSVEEWYLNNGIVARSKTKNKKGKDTGSTDLTKMLN
jgi:hypothetical protein